MIKSACIEMLFTEVPFEERFELAKKSGFDSIEFWSWDDKNLVQIKELCQKNKLTVSSFSGDKAFSLVDRREKKEYIDFIVQSMEAAKFLDCRNLVIHSNALGDGGIVVNHYNDIPEKVRFMNMLLTLKELKPIAESNEIVLALEALNIHLDHVGNALAYTKDSAMLIELVNSPYIKVLYDVYHMQINEGNLIDTLTKNIDKIGYIHVADVPGRHEPGTGEINYKNVFKALASLQYNNVIGFELSPRKDTGEAVRSIMKYEV
jgi:hydroxypyruvate isomerase